MSTDDLDFPFLRLSFSPRILFDLVPDLRFPMATRKNSQETKGIFTGRKCYL